MYSSNSQQLVTWGSHQIKECQVDNVPCSITSMDFFDRLLYCSQKQLPSKMKSRLVIIRCAGYIFWQLFFAATIFGEAGELSAIVILNGNACVFSKMTFISIYNFNMTVYIMSLCILCDVQCT